MNSQELSPKEIVRRLDQYIVGQTEAKKAVAIALRNRYRRLLLDDEMKKEITPKNILMIGPTGVGKTEIARRLASILDAPFTKVEATKFTEVGYVGRDVESMVRDLTETGITIIKDRKRKAVHQQAREKAIKKLAIQLVPIAKKERKSSYDNPYQALFNQLGLNANEAEQEQAEDVTEEIATKRKEVEDQLRRGVLNGREVTIQVEESKQTATGPMADQFEQMGIDLSDTFSALKPPKMIDRDVTIEEALEVFTEQEADQLIQTEDIESEAIELVENHGIIFLDEIDKIASGSERSQAQVSREGVQRDILPIVEGSVVKTKYGNVKTDYILFIGSGAFHQSAPSDLIPELQGRFPIRVELDDLTQADFVRILIEPENSLIKQYQALLETEGVAVQFTMDAIEKMADIAYQVNERTDNIGARRLYTVIEKLLEDLLFEAGDMDMGNVQITEKYVNNELKDIVEDRDLTRYIL